MKRILFVHHVAAVGGGSYCMLNLIKYLDRTEFEPYALLGEDGPLAEELKKEGVPVAILRGLCPLPYDKALYRRSCLQRYLAQPSSLRLFNNYLSDNSSFDIVYLNNMLLCPLLSIGKRHGCKTVIHVREHWSRNSHPIQFYAIRRMITRNADVVIAINNFSSSMISAPQKTHVIYDWISFDGRRGTASYEDVFGETSDLKIFLFAGGLNPIKGVHEVVEAFHKTPRADYRLLILGDESRCRMSPRMRCTLNTMNNDSRIRCIPPSYQIQQLIEKAYCTISFFTIPHANLMLAESVICNTVAIAAETEEARDYSGDGRLAKLFRFGNRQALADAIMMSEEEHAELKDRLMRDSEQVRLQFDRERNVSQWHDVMNNL